MHATGHRPRITSRSARPARALATLVEPRLRRISHVGTIPFVTMRDRDSRHEAVRDAATAQVTVTADQDSVRGGENNNSDHHALPNRAHGAPPLHHQITRSLTLRRRAPLATQVVSQVPLEIGQRVTHPPALRPRSHRRHEPDLWHPSQSRDAPRAGGRLPAVVSLVRLALSAIFRAGYTARGIAGR